MDVFRKENREELFSCLPEAIRRALCLAQNAPLLSCASELRLRRERVQSLTVGKENYILSSDGLFVKEAYLPQLLSEEELRESVARLCGGSIFAHAEELRRGYVTKGGCRVGICGKAVTENGLLRGFCEYDALNIRLPVRFRARRSRFFGIFPKTAVRQWAEFWCCRLRESEKRPFYAAFAQCFHEGFRTAVCAAAHGYAFWTSGRRFICPLFSKKAFAIF